ncbi:MAG TPA: ATP-binding protein [Myxococcota bacterium]
MALSRWLVLLPFQETNPERLAKTVRRVSTAYGVATSLFALALASGVLGPRRVQMAWVALLAAAGFPPIALLAKRWPVHAAAAFVLWIWGAGFTALVASQGRLEVTSGIFLTAIVAAGLMLGGRWAIASALATAIGSGVVMAWFARSGAFAAARPFAPLPLWAVTTMNFAALPVLLGEALGRLRRALRDAEQAEGRYRLVADNARDLIFVIERDVLTYVSPASLPLLGWTPEEMLARGSNLQGFTPDSAQLIRATLARSMAEGVSNLRYEAEMLRKGGETLWCEVEVSLLRDEAGRVHGMIGVTRDISERRRVEADRERIQAELVQAQKMEIVGRLAAGIAHDLNNQLTVIVAGAEALSDDSAALRGEIQKDIQDSAQNAASLTRQLQAFSRRRAGVAMPCDLNDLVARLDRTLRRVLGSDVELNVRPAASPAVVQVDAPQIEQVILNLAVNARDAMPAGGRLTIEIAPGGAAEPNAWRIRVSDTGTGIDEATLPRIFEPFFTTKADGRGTGLGLSMVRRVIDEVGGRVRLETDVGRGTTFEVALPRYDGPSIRAAEAPSESAAANGAASILVVDDSTEVRRLLCNALTREGHRVVEAPNPASALQIAGSLDTLDLVVTDIVMPGRNGPELVEALRRQRPGLPVLYVSGYAGESFDIDGDERAAVLWKPFSMSALRRAVRSALGGAPGASDGDDGD